MADGFSMDVDSATLLQALDRIGPALEVRLKEAARVTANAIAREARGRLQRQLGPEATGAAVAGIVAEEDYTGDGYVVLSAVPVDQRIALHRNSRTGRTHTQAVTVNNLPLWLEKGTKRGQGTHSNYPRPFFYASVALEEGAHWRRLIEAVNAMIDDEGLGT